MEDGLRQAGLSKRGAGDALEHASAEWAAVLGPERVLTESSSRARYARTTGAFGPEPAAVVRPRSSADVVAVVRIASKYGTPLYPISRGRNWGMGSACPVTEGQVVVDLRDLDRIIEVDSELAYAVVEPGVTQGQLASYLVERHPGLMMDATGSSRDSSIVGNVLERGDAFGPNADRFLNSAGYEVVLADGTIAQTGFAQFDVGNAYLGKWGLGPALDGLFTQSSFGIVTKLAIFLSPKPASIRAYAFVLDEAKLVDFVNAVRPLRQSGLIQQPIHLFNRPNATRAGTKAERKWTGFGGFYGDPRQTSLSGEILQEWLRGITNPIFFTGKQLELAKKSLAAMSALTPKRLRERLTEYIAGGTEMLSMLAGAPRDSATRQFCARGKIAGPRDSLDPAEFGVGMYWLSHVCPANGTLDEAIRLMKRIYVDHAIQPQITVVVMTGRALLLNLTVFFDKTDSAASANATSCRNALQRELTRAGFPPQRLGIEGMAEPGSEQSTYWELVRRIKHALDPDSIIAPGRYAPWMLTPPG